MVGVRGESLGLKLGNEWTYLLSQSSKIKTWKPRKMWRVSAKGNVTRDKLLLPPGNLVCTVKLCRNAPFPSL